MVARPEVSPFSPSQPSRIHTVPAPIAAVTRARPVGRDLAFARGGVKDEMGMGTGWEVGRAHSVLGAQAGHGRVPGRGMVEDGVDGPLVVGPRKDLVEAEPTRQLAQDPRVRARL